MKRITVDLTKASTETLDLTSVLNPRVGDGQLSVPLHIIYGTDDSGNDDPVDMRDKDIEFLSQDTNKNDIYVSGTVTTNSKGDDPYNGNVTFVFPEGTFKVAGTYDVDKTMFRIINKADKIVLSTVNVKLNVLEGGNSDYNFDPNKTSYNSRLEDMLKLAQSQMKDKIANADKEAQAALTDAKQKAADIVKNANDQAQSLLDDIKQTNDEAKGNVAGDTAATAKQAKQQANDNAGKVHDLQGEVSDARGRFMTLSDRENKQDFNIDRKEDKANANSNYAAINLRDDQQDKAIAEKASQSFITDYLSRMYLQPEGFENEAALKAKYPTGKEGIFVTVDTGHKWIYANGQWNDCGVYQSAGIAKHSIKSSDTDFTLYQQNLYDQSQAQPGAYNINDNKITYQDSSVDERYGKLTCFKFQRGSERTFTVSGTDFTTFGSTADGTLAWADNHNDGMTGPYTFTVPENVVWIYVAFYTNKYADYKIYPGEFSYDKEGKSLLKAPLATPLADGIVTPEATTFITKHQNIYQAAQARNGIYNLVGKTITYQDSSVDQRYGTLTCFKFQRGSERTFTVSGTDFTTFGSTADGTLAWADNHNNGEIGPYTFTVPENVVWIYVAYLTDKYQDYQIVPGTSLETGYQLDKKIKIPSMNDEIHVGQGYQCHRLIDAIKLVQPLANNQHQFTIYIHDDSTDFTGTTYDLLAELGGTSYLTTIENAKDNMQGFHLPPYVNLVGVGKVTLKAELPDNVSLNQSTNFSTLEIEQGNNSLRNLTVKVKNGRYPVHDESRDKYPNAIHNYENVIFIHEGNAAGLWDSQSAFGCGTSGGCVYNFNDCIFDASQANGYPFGLHNYAPQLGSQININGAQMLINQNRPVAMHFGFNGFSPVTSDKDKYAACYTDVYIKNVNSEGSILVEPETDQYNCTNNYRIHNFTALKENIKDNVVK